MERAVRHYVAPRGLRMGGHHAVSKVRINGLSCCASWSTSARTVEWLGRSREFQHPRILGAGRISALPSAEGPAERPVRT